MKGKKVEFVGWGWGWRLTLLVGWVIMIKLSIVIFGGCRVELGGSSARGGFP